MCRIEWISTKEVHGANIKLLSLDFKLTLYAPVCYSKLLVGEGGY